MATGDADETAFWAKMIEQLAGGVPGADSNTTLMAGQANPCSFDQSLDQVNQQLYELGDNVPSWSLTWDGTKRGDFFGTYADWVSQVHPPTSQDPTLAQDTADLATLQQKIINYNDGIEQIRLGQYKAFIANNCLSPSADGTSCTTWMPGANAQDFAASWTKYQTGSIYKTQVAALVEDAGDGLAGLQSKHDTLALKVYGPNYQQLAEAHAAVQLADPMNLSNPLSGKKLAPYQMETRQGGTDKQPVDVLVPRYQMDGYTPEQYSSWLADAKAGKGSQVTLALQTSDHETDTSKWQFAAGASVPVEDIFMIGASASGEHHQVSIANYDFHMEVTYKSVVHIPLSPATSWYEGNLLQDYRNFIDFEPGSVFAGQPMWGPTGMFNMRTTGVYVGFGTDIKFTVADFNSFTSETSWHEDVSFSLFGLIKLGLRTPAGGQHKAR